MSETTGGMRAVLDQIESQVKKQAREAGPTPFPVEFLGAIPDIRNVTITLSEPDLGAKVSRRTDEYFIERYRNAIRQRAENYWHAAIQEAAALVWEEVGEDVEQAAAIEQVKRLAEQVSQLDAEIERLTRALKHLQIDPVSL